MAATDDVSDDEVPGNDVSDHAPADLLKEMPPEVARLLYPHRTRESTYVTVIFPELPAETDDDVRRRVEELVRRASRHDERADPRFPLEDSVHVTRYELDRIEALHGLYETLAPIHGSERVRLLINDAEVPLATELWLPLLWTLLP